MMDIHLYRNGVHHIDVGTVESTMQIDEDYCKRFIEELDLVSLRMIEGKYPELTIGLFDWLKPYDDVRSYIKDPVSGKTIAESYGRSGDDITHQDKYEVVRCETKDTIGETIYRIRKTVYDIHNQRRREIGEER